MLFLTQTSIAEPLGQTSQEVQQKGNAATETKTPGATRDAAPIGDASDDTDKTNAAGPKASVAAIDNSESGAESAASSGDENVESSAEASTPAVTFTATAYSLRGRTASGMGVSRGLIAADRRLLPIGTRVRLEAGSYSGEYLVADTGGAVRGRRIDIWVPNTAEAMRFGRRPIRLTVLTRTRSRTTSPQSRN
jgi:3D (Asp-Asp-Asp) domain-containing protein